jgi:hypothetical protein
MNEPSERFERQAKWQKSLRELSWPEKVRMAAKLRDAMRALRGSRKPTSPGTAS